MDIWSKEQYKSVEPISIKKIPDLMILSGINGSGKTHFLNGIDANIIKVFEDNGPELKKIKFVNNQSLYPSGETTTHFDAIKNEINTVWIKYDNFRKNKNSNPRLDDNHLFQDDQNFKEKFLFCMKKSNKNIENITYDDLNIFYPINNNDKNIFHHNFTKIFKHYHIRKDENDYNKYRNEKWGQDINFISEEIFKNTYGDPPWKIVNKVLEEANSDYYINSPEKDNKDAPFVIKLINKNNKVEINFEDLSSGEKVLMCLVLSLYNSKQDFEFPQVLLMDEPDSPLHPSMIKQLIDVTNNLFINEKKMKVIIATHSPTTVALAPEESLYVMNKQEPRIEKISREKAIRNLLAGVNSISFNYENRRHVFVESYKDVIFYDKIYQKIYDRLIPEISIHFISSGNNGSGSCKQVDDIVKKLNNTVYGIIDWDLQNKSKGNIKVLGENKRYSIENYIFDPINLIIFLLRETIIEKSKLKLTESEKYFDIKSFENERLQEIVDLFFYEFNKDDKYGSNRDTEECLYISEKKVNLPKWFLQIKGHDLEKIIKTEFKELNKFQKENELKKEIINKIIDNFPNFIQKELLDLFIEIQK